MGTLWEGRLSGATTDALKALNDSLEIDKRLYREDILGSIAHVEMLVTVASVVSKSWVKASLWPKDLAFRASSRSALISARIRGAILCLCRSSSRVFSNIGSSCTVFRKFVAPIGRNRRIGYNAYASHVPDLACG